MTAPPDAPSEPTAPGPPAPEPDPFREYHRAETRARLTQVVVTVVVAVGAIAGVTALASAAPPPTAAPASDARPEPGPSSEPDPSATPTPTALPSPAVSADASPGPTPTPSGEPGSRVWTIAIDTRGYQAEIDQCLWVRMDLGAAAPLVGAHNYCGGGVVLEMAVGDTVVLTGEDLDGTYRVTEERLAHAGDPAAGATEGITASVILQTCFWEDDGRERLLALVAEG